MQEPGGNPPSQKTAERATETEREKLLLECLSGQREQIGNLVNLYRPYLLAIARGEWRGELNAKEGLSDLVQETIIKGVEAFTDFRGTTEQEFTAWLRQILVRRIQNKVRKYQTEARHTGREESLHGHETSASGDSPSAALVTTEKREKLQIALGQLPPDSMEVVRLRQFENLGWDEIGARMDRSPDAARKLWARAVLQLQANIELQTYVADTPTPPVGGSE